jgi:hypothetical protein
MRKPTGRTPRTSFSTRSKSSRGETVTSMRSSLPYSWSANCAAAISIATNSASLKSSSTRAIFTSARPWPNPTCSLSPLVTPSRRARLPVIATSKSPSPNASVPYKVVVPRPARVISRSITGEKWALTGKRTSKAMRLSSTPPLAEICRSVLPTIVVIEDWNDPAAASPASSIPITTATPSATAISVRLVRSKSRRKGRRIIIFKSLMCRGPFHPHK